jgi:hypothetical protein
LAVKDEDILEFNGGSYTLLFDGSAVGVGSGDVDAFYFIDADSILISFDGSLTISGVGAVADSDIVRFDATRLGLNNTAGTFTMYFDGSDVGLDTSAEDIDAIELLADGRLLISTEGNFSVAGVSALDEDVVAFTPTSLGPNTSGAWAMYFDGSVVGLTSSGEDVDGLSIATNGDLYLSTRENFAVPGISGTDEDIFVCKPSAARPIISCTYAPTLFFDGSLWGLGSSDLDAIDLVKNGQQAAAAGLMAVQAVEQPGVADDPAAQAVVDPEEVEDPVDEPENAEPVEEAEEVTEPVQNQQIFLPLVQK